MLTNQIAQLEVGNFHKHLPRGGYFLPKAMLILFGPWYKLVTSLSVGFYAIDTTLGRSPRDITYMSEVV